MANYISFGTESFWDDFNRLTQYEKNRIDGFITQIEENGDKVGKPLGGYSFFREKKFNGNRAYFLVYSEWKAALLVSIAPKKLQSETIEKIKSELPFYREFVRKILIEKGII
jgi:hypothetical protein